MLRLLESSLSQFKSMSWQRFMNILLALGLGLTVSAAWFNSNHRILPPAPSAAKAPVGIVNLANTCYLNAILQSLYALPSFRERVFVSKMKPHTVGCELKTLFEKIRQLQQTGVTASSSPKPFALVSVMDINILIQEDVEEMLLRILNDLDDSLLLPAAAVPAGPSAGPTDPSEHTEPAVPAADGSETIPSAVSPQPASGKPSTLPPALPAHPAHPAVPGNDSSSPTALFKFSTLQSITCTDTGHVNTKHLLNLDLSLNLAGGCLEDALREHFAVEQLSEPYHCSEHGRVAASKGLELEGYPQVLMVHLKRFAYRDGMLKKVSKRSVLCVCCVLCTASCAAGEEVGGST